MRRGHVISRSRDLLLRAKAPLSVGGRLRHLATAADVARASSRRRNTGRRIECRRTSPNTLTSGKGQRIESLRSTRDYKTFRSYL